MKIWMIHGSVFCTISLEGGICVVRLEHIHVEGFKSIRNMDLAIKPLNVLIGANGAGKSNFLSFVRMMNYLTTNGLQTYVGQAGGANTVLHYGSKRTPQMSAVLKFSTEQGTNTYSVRLASAANDSLLFTDEQISYTRRGKTVETPLRSLGSGHKESLLGDEGLDQSVAKTARAIRNLMGLFRFYQFHDTSSEARIKKMCSIEDNGYLRSDAGNMAAFLYLLQHKHDKYYRRIVETIREVAPFFDDFVLKPSALNESSLILKWREKGSNEIFLPDQLSDGTLRMMALVTLLLQPKMPPLICIDEPELGLHPYAIQILASLVKAASSQIQVIVSTQSAALVDLLDPGDLVVVNRKDGQSVFEHLDGDALSDWLRDYSLGELWEKNVIGGRPSK